MGIFHLNPIFFRFFHTFLQLIIYLFCFSLHHVTEIHFICQYSLYRSTAPHGFYCTGKSPSVICACGLLILFGWKDTKFIQFIRYGWNRHTLHFPVKNLTHNFRCIIIHHKLIFVVICLSVPIKGKRSNTLPILSLYFKLAFHFCGNISAIGIVNEVFDRKNNTTLPCIRMKTVIMVCQRNKTHRKSREDFLYISPGFNIVTPKTRKVFYNDAIHLSCFDVTYHSFKFWSVEITARKPIININIIQFDILLFMDKGSD